MELESSYSLPLQKDSSRIPQALDWLNIEVDTSSVSELTSTSEFDANIAIMNYTVIATL